MSVTFAGDESDSEVVKETIGTYEYVGKLKGSSHDVFWKPNPDFSHREQFFLYHGGNNVIFQVSIITQHDISSNI